MHIAIWKILTDVLKGVGARFFSQLREIMRRDSREIPAPVGRPKKPRLAGTLSIIPGVGQLYLGQTAKGLLMLVTSYPGFPLFVITIPLGVLDAYILGLRLARRPIRRWECFWNREPPEVWTVAEVRQLGRMEEPIGTETRVIDNSDSPIGCTRTESVSRTWWRACSLQVEGSEERQDIELLANNSPAIRSVKSAVREQFRFEKGFEEQLKQGIKIEVPAYRKVTLILRWKNILEAGEVIQKSNYGQMRTDRIYILVGVAFDQALKGTYDT